MKRAQTILLAAVFLLACYAPVFAAADWDLYGSARMATFWTDYDEDHAFGPGDTTQLNHDLQGNAVIGATVQNGPIGGGFKYGTEGGNANIRLLYATFDAGPGQLLVGQDYGPFAMGSYISNQVYNDDNNMSEFIGDTYYRPMIQYTVDNFSFALVTPERADIENLAPGGADADGDDSELLFPQIQARYHTMFNGIGFNIAGVFQTYDLKDDTEGWDGETLNAWAVTANMRFTQLDPLYVNFGGYYGQNVANFGQSWGGSRVMGSAELDGDSIEDTDTWGLLLVAGTMVNDIGLEAGFGYLESDNDVAGDTELMAAYAQAKIPMLTGFDAYIIPEIGYYEWDNGANFDEFYAGVQWRVDF